MRTRTQRIASAALLAALIFIATRFIQLPLPAVGYVNMGDGLVILAGWMLSPGYGFLAAGIGAALADVLSPFVIYAPVTFAIKGLMAVIVHFVFKTLKQKNRFAVGVAGGMLAEIVMIVGYLLFEGALYGFKTAIVSIPFNAIQGLVGVVVGVVLISVFSKRKMG